MSAPVRVAAAGADERPCVMQIVLSLNAGGTERLTIEIARRLADRFRFVVCCLDDDGEWAGELREEGIPVIALERASGFQPRLSMRLARLAAEHGASVIHCHHYSPFVYGWMASVIKRPRRFIFTEHGRLSDAPPTPRRRFANAFLGRSCGSTFAVSAALRAHMIDEGFPAHRVGVIHNGIDPGAVPGSEQRLAARRRLGIEEHAFVVGTAARLDPVKDLVTFVRAAALARARVPTLRVVIIGSGSEQPALEAAARDAGVADIVRLVGFRTDVRDLLPGFDLFANSSISEGVSLTILEAMAAAVPVVATRVGGTPEVVVDGETGVLVAARAPAAMAEAIVTLARSGRRSDVGAAARARLEQLFSIDRMVNAYAREYCGSAG